MIRARNSEYCWWSARSEPFRHGWALPGGFVRRGSRGCPDENLDEAARRVLPGARASRLGRSYLTQLGAYGDPGRDPRGESCRSPTWRSRQGTGSSKVQGVLREPSWYPMNTALAAGDALAFDHARILADGVCRTLELVETTALGLAFCHEWFTIADLRHVYENLWELPADSLDAGNFHHRVMGLKGLVEPVSEEELAMKAAWDRETERRLGMMATLPEAPGGRGRPPKWFKRGPLVRERGVAVPLERPFARPRS